MKISIEFERKDQTKSHVKIVMQVYLTIVALSFIVLLFNSFAEKTFSVFLSTLRETTSVRRAKSTDIPCFREKPVNIR